MMRHTRQAKLLAVSVALVFHSVLAVAVVAPETTNIEGVSGGTDVRLGNAFSDMAAGTLAAERPDVAEPTQVEAAERSESEQPESLTPETVTAEASRAVAETIKPADPTETPSSPTPQTVATPEPAIAAQPVQNEPTSRSENVTSAAVVTGQTAVLERSQVAERVAAEDPETAPLSRSLRPRPRSPDIVAAAQPKPKPAAPPQARGNADRNARAGEAIGRQQATARQSGAEGRSEAAGNAAASNYPGLVMRQLSRAGRPSVNARGSAVVSFSIATNGSVASVSLARSSGSAQLDQAALRLVGGAGPFPAPPQGARRSFSVQIQGR